MYTCIYTHMCIYAHMHIYQKMLNTQKMNTLFALGSGVMNE